LLSQVANAFVGEAQVPKVEALDRAIGALEIPASAETMSGAPQHLLFLVRTLREDCRKLCLLAAASQRA
jgi:hypothetical protein